MTVFEDHNYRIAGSAEEEIGMYYVSPSQMTRFGGVMPIQERLELVGRAEKEHFLIIEDDYNSEFKYFQKPVPSLQGLSGGRNVIYLGTFSKMLLPSIRISYMILPPELMETYEKRKNNYNQTASKAEQIALTQFIRDGHLASQVRKSRKIHLAKAEKLADKDFRKRCGCTGWCCRIYGTVDLCGGLRCRKDCRKSKKERNDIS